MKAKETSTTSFFFAETADTFIDRTQATVDLSPLKDREKFLCVHCGRPERADIRQAQRNNLKVSFKDEEAG